MTSEPDAEVVRVVDAGPGAIDASSFGMDADLDAAMSWPDAAVPTDASAPTDVTAPIDAVAPRDAAQPTDAVTSTDAYVTRLTDAPAGDADAITSCVHAPESCNGIDDDCNGSVDEGVCSVRSGGSRVTCTARRTSLGTSAYLVCNVRVTWDQARAICRSFSPGYDHVAFADSAEQAAVRGWMSSGLLYWIGLTDSPSRVSTASATNYRWVDGTAPSYTDWAPSEPNVASHGCVRMSPTAPWDAVRCGDEESEARFVCEIALR